MKLAYFMPIVLRAQEINERLIELEQRVEQLERRASFSSTKASFSYGLNYCQNPSVPGIDTERYNFKGKGRIPLDYKFYDSLHDFELNYAGDELFRH